MTNAHTANTRKHVTKKTADEIRTRTPADKPTLLAFAADRRVSACPTRRAAIGRYLLPAGPTAANPPHAAAAVDRRDGRTDGRTAGRCVNPLCQRCVLPHAVLAVSATACI